MQIDGDVLFGLLKKTSSHTYKHLVSSTLMDMLKYNYDLIISEVYFPVSPSLQTSEFIPWKNTF